MQRSGAVTVIVWFLDFRTGSWEGYGGVQTHVLQKANVLDIMGHSSQSVEEQNTNRNLDNKVQITTRFQREAKTLQKLYQREFVLFTI